MTHTMILVQRKALAIEDAFEVLEEISPTERLIEAKSEPVHEPEYALPILVAELAQVVADQQARIVELEERLEAKGSRSRSGGSSAGKKRS